MAQKLAPVEKNSTDISAASAAFCISGLEQGLVQLTGASDTEPGGAAKLVVELFGKQHRKPFLVLFALCALYPLTGMFNIAFFAIDLFEKLGIGNEQAVAVSSALARALGTCFSSLLIHR